LRLAHWTARLFGWTGLAYDDLGLVGPAQVRFKDRVTVIDAPAFGHSTWFTTQYFNDTLQQITRRCPRNHERNLALLTGLCLTAGCSLNYSTPKTAIQFNPATKSVTIASPRTLRSKVFTCVARPTGG